MDAMPLQIKKPLTRTESFQRMLDLEKRCKLARLNTTQKSTTTDTSLDPQPCVQNLSSTNYMPLSPRTGEASTPLWQIDHLPPLSIAIPSPCTREGGICAHSKQEDADHATAAAFDTQLNHPEISCNTMTQERPEGQSNDNASQYHEDDDRSDQSSICQSPSWEGYDQKKKMKKKQQEADHQRRESDRIGQIRKVTANKRSSNRLFKVQPGEIPNHAKPRKRSSGASVSVLAESSNTAAIKPGMPKLPFRQTHGLNARGIGESPAISGSMSTAGLDMDQLPSSQVAFSAELAHQGDRTLAARLSSDDKERREDAITLSNEKMSYPPPSSRSHILKNVVLSSHYRRKSASAVSSQTTNSLKGRDTKINQPSEAPSGGNLLLGLTAEPASRGRLSTSNGETDSYVHRARTQSVERSIKGFMLEAALSSPGLVTQADDAGLFYLNQLRQQQPLSVYQRPSPTQSAHTLNSTPSDGLEGEHLPISKAAKKSLSLLDPQLDEAFQLSREQRQEREQASQNRLDDVRMPHNAEQPMASTRLDFPTKDCNLGPKSSSTTSLDTAIPTAGIFSSIKTRISRRGSTSGGPSFASAGRSFKERALGVMHFPSNSTMAQCGKTSAGKPSENASKLTIASMSGIRSYETGRSLPSLPKPARLLGELNAETMSQRKARGRSRPSEGSSASSYHECSSAPVSLASTPDTSRPQSTKGFPVGIGKTQHEDTEVFISGQKSTATTSETRLVQNGSSSSKSDNASRGKTERVRPRSDGSQQTYTEESSPAANSVVDSPASQIGSLGEGPDSHGQTSQDFGRATTSIPGDDACGELQPHATDGTALSCAPSGNLSRGLGISNGPRAQSIAASNADDRFSDIIIATPNSGASAAPQPETPPATAVRNLSKLMEEKQEAAPVSNPDPSGRHPRSQLISHVAPAETWVPRVSGSQNAQPGSDDSLKDEKHTFASAKSPGAMGDCVEPVQAFEKPAASLSTVAVAGSTTTTTTALPDRSESFVSLQQHEDQSSAASTNTSSCPSAPPKGAMGTKSDTYTTRPMNHAAHGRGHSTGTVHLQEVRRSAPTISSPLSTVIRNTAKLSSRRYGGGASNSTPSLCAAERVLPSPSPTLSQFRLPEPAFGPRQPDLVRGSSVSIGSSSISSGSISLSSGSGGRKKAPLLPVPQPNRPLAKMLVECCRCKFFHDMPSRVYECMAHPNAVVTDCDLGVSGAITTMVKCPWCSHNMRTQCCAGYAAVVYLKERLH